MQKIIVVGSSNTDMIVKTVRLPASGETIADGCFSMNLGGGVSQAVAAARLGGEVAVVTKLGVDGFGEFAFEQFKKEQISTEFVSFDSYVPSGVALINVNKEGESCTVVSPGANGYILPIDAKAALETLRRDDIVVLQLAIPMETVAYVAATAAQRGAKVILSPVPAQKLSANILENLYLITPNEAEAAILSDMEISDICSVRKAAAKLCAAGVKNVIITMGCKGAYLYSTEHAELIEGNRVKGVDIEVASDSFNGALAVAISENKGLKEAIVFACASASISVSGMVTQASLPYRNEVEEYMTFQEC